MDGAMTVISQIQALTEAPAFSSLENLEPAGRPGHGRSECFGRVSGAASQRTRVSSDLVRLCFSEFAGSWPRHSLASAGRPVETAFAGWGYGAVCPWM